MGVLIQKSCESKMTETESVKNGATYFFTVATVTIAVFIAAVGMVFMNTDCDLLLWAADYIGSSPSTTF